MDSVIATYSKIYVVGQGVPLPDENESYAQLLDDSRSARLLQRTILINLINN